MSPKAVVSNVICKPCGKKFARLEWLKNRECDCPEKCGCPEVKKAMQQAQSTINKARKMTTFVVERTSRSLPTQRNPSLTQYHIPVEPLVVIEIKRSRKKDV